MQYNVFKIDLYYNMYQSHFLSEAKYQLDTHTHTHHI